MAVNTADLQTIYTNVVLIDSSGSIGESLNFWHVTFRKLLTRSKCGVQYSFPFFITITYYNYDVLTNIALKIEADTPLATSYSPCSLGFTSSEVLNILHKVQWLNILQIKATQTHAQHMYPRPQATLSFSKFTKKAQGHGTWQHVSDILSRTDLESTEIYVVTVVNFVSWLTCVVIYSFLAYLLWFFVALLEVRFENE